MPLLTDRLDLDELALMAWLALLASGRWAWVGPAYPDAAAARAEVAAQAFAMAAAFKAESERRHAETPPAADLPDDESPKYRSLD